MRRKFESVRIFRWLLASTVVLASCGPKESDESEMQVDKQAVVTRESSLRSDSPPATVQLPLSKEEGLQEEALLHSGGSSGMTESEWNQATRRIWEQPGEEHLKPPQRVLDAATGPQPNHRPPAAAIKKQAQFLQEWKREEQRLQDQGYSDEQVAVEYLVFKRQTFGP